MSNIYKVIQPFNIYLDNDYDWATGIVTDFKVNDLVKVNDENGEYSISYPYQDGSGQWKLMAHTVDRANLKFVTVCGSSYSGYDDECISPNAPVIDNANANTQAIGSGVTKFFKAPFGLSPLLGYSVLIGGTAILVLGAVMILKAKK